MKLIQQIIHTKDASLRIISVFLLLCLASTTISHKIILKEIKTDHNEILVSYEAICDDIDTDILEENRYQLEQTWSQNFLAQFLEIAHVNINDQESGEVVSDIGLLFPDSIYSFLDYLISNSLLVLNGTLPTDPNQVIVSRGIYGELKANNSGNDLLGEEIPMNLTYGLETKVSSIVTVNITGYFDIMLDLDIVRDMIDYRKTILYFNSYFNDWRESSLRFNVDPFETNLIIGRLPLGLSLYDRFYDTDDYNHFLLKSIILADGNTSEMRFDSELVKQSLDIIQNNDAANSWDIAESEIMNVIQEWNRITAFFKFIFSVLLIFIIIFIYGFRNFYLKSHKLENESKIEQLMILGLDYKEIIRSFLFDETKTVLKLFLFANLADLILNTILISVLPIPYSALIYQFNLFVYSVATFSAFSMLIVIKYISVRKIVYEKEFFETQVQQESENFKTMGRKPIYENDLNETISDPVDKSITKTILRIVLYSLFIFSLIFPLLIPKEILYENPPIFDAQSLLYEIFPYDWATLIGFVPFYMIITLTVLPSLLVRLVFPFIKFLIKWLSYANKRYSQAINIRKRTRYYLARILSISENNKRSLFLIFIFSVSIISSIVNTTYLSVDYDRELSRAAFGSDLILYSSSDDSNQINYSYRLLSQYESVNQISIIANTNFFYGKPEYTGGHPSEMHDAAALSPVNYSRVVDLEDIVMESIPESILPSTNGVDLEYFALLEDNPEYVIISNSFAIRYGLKSESLIDLNFTLINTNQSISENYVNRTFKIAGTFSFLPGIESTNTQLIFNRKYYNFSMTETRFCLNLSDDLDRIEFSKEIRQLYTGEFPVVKLYAYEVSGSILTLKLINNLSVAFLFIFMSFLLYILYIELDATVIERRKLLEMGIEEQQSRKIQLYNVLWTISTIMVAVFLLSIAMIWVLYRLQDLFYLFGINLIDPFEQWGSYLGGNSLPFNSNYEFKFGVSPFIYLIFIVIIILVLIFARVQFILRKNESKMGLS